MIRLACVVVLAVLSQADGALAQVNEGDLTAYPIGELTAQGDGYPTLIGGKPVKNPADWPANFYSSSIKGSCTSTLVSSNVLFTAAHCVGNGKMVTIKTSAKTYTGTCTHAAEYPANDTADYALCLMTEAVPSKAYERINTDPALLKKDGMLKLTGFGCTKPGGTGGNDGVYRIGEAPIQRLPVGDDNDIVTEGEVALCFGDSGGPAYLQSGKDEAGPRAQVSINSRGNIYNISHLSSLSTPMAIKFMKSWSEKNGAKICGLHADAKDCHK